MAQLKQELDEEKSSAVTLKEEWTQKLMDAQAGSSVAVDEVTKQLTEKLEQQAQAHQLVVAEKERELREALEEVDVLRRSVHDGQSASEQVRSCWFCDIVVLCVLVWVNIADALCGTMWWSWFG